MMPSYAIEVDQLNKRYGKTQALNGLSFRVPVGSLSGLIGVNGAGKTTTIKILLDIARGNSGSAKVFGLSANDAESSLKIRQRLAYLPESKTLFPGMTVKNLIDFVRPFYPNWDHEQELRLRNKLIIPLETRLCDLSKGTLGKLHLLVALSHHAELLILDEPTDGLDALATQTILEELTRIVAMEGCTVLFCTHRIEEVEQIADRVILMHDGKTMIEESIDDLREQARRVDGVFSDAAMAAARLGKYGICTSEGRAVSVLTWKQAAEAEAEAYALGASEVVSSPVTLRQLFVEMIRGLHVVA